MGKIDKSNWPEGPWIEEVDELEWVDFLTGYKCLVIRHPEVGSLCGYVRVPEGHPLHGKNGDELMDIEVHGGVTYSGSRGKDGEWWLGFDCAHYMDYLPGVVAALMSANATDEITEVKRQEVYRNMAYCWEECMKLAVQLKRLQIK